MNIFFITLGAMLFIVLAMSIGVIMGRKPISGSCGGMAAIGMEGSCDICGGDLSKCDGEGGELDSTTAASEANDLAYDATRKDSDA